MLFRALLLALSVTLSVASPLHKRTVPFYSPLAGGGSMLDSSAGLGEPLNVIISGLSSTKVLNKRESSAVSSEDVLNKTEGLELEPEKELAPEAGFLNYLRSIGFSTECGGFHIGTPQTANLGDGNGAQNEIKVMRQDFGHADVGTCLESVIGGNHLRYWRQNGPSANSGALFLAVSHEKSAADHHDIVPNGYDRGRDELVASAVGTTSFGGVTYSTVAKNITGLLQPGSNGINHNIAIDGVVILLTVTIQ